MRRPGDTGGSQLLAGRRHAFKNHSARRFLDQHETVMNFEAGTLCALHRPYEITNKECGNG